MARDLYEDKDKFKDNHPKTDDTIPSPCISACMYDDTESFCIGCYRTPKELQDWWVMTKEEKLKTLNEIEERKKG